LQNSDKSLGQKGDKGACEETQNVKECLQGKHGFESQEQCQWMLLPPTDVDGFVGGKIWAIARVGDMSDVRKVEMQRLNAQVVVRQGTGEKNSEIAGLLAADKFRSTNQHHNRGMRVTKAQCIDATMDFIEKSGVFNSQYEKWFDAAANMSQNNGSKDVCRLKQTCTPKGAARKYLTTVNDVMILNYTVVLDVARVGQNPIPRACGLVNCLLTVFLYNYSPSRQNSFQTSENRLTETFRVRSQARQMNMLWCNQCFHHKHIASCILAATVTLGVKESKKVKTL